MSAGTRGHIGGCKVVVRVLPVVVVVVDEDDDEEEEEKEERQVGEARGRRVLLLSILYVQDQAPAFVLGTEDELRSFVSR